MDKPVFKYSIAVAAGLILPLVAGAPDAEAMSYAKKLPNGKVCRVAFGETHLHAANGAHASRVKAQAIAISDWSSFVQLEYGGKWRNWTLALKKSMTCMNDKDAGVWRCRAEAQPCKS